MAKMTFVLSDELEKRFRRYMQMMDYRKGHYTQYIEALLRKHLDKVEKKVKDAG